MRHGGEHVTAFRWDAVHIKKSQRVGFTKENPGAKAVLISGPPGACRPAVTHPAWRAVSSSLVEVEVVHSLYKLPIQTSHIEIRIVGFVDGL